MSPDAEIHCCRFAYTRSPKTAFSPLPMHYATWTKRARALFIDSIWWTAIVLFVPLGPSLDDLMKSLQKILELSILVVTHDPTTLVTVCDRISMIADKKVEIGTLDELLASSNPKIKEYFHIFCFPTG